MSAYHMLGFHHMMCVLPTNGKKLMMEVHHMMLVYHMMGIHKIIIHCVSLSFFAIRMQQGGRTWQAFGGGKNGHETFRQVRIYNFRDKWVVFARNLKFSNLTH